MSHFPSTPFPLQFSFHKSLQMRGIDFWWARGENTLSPTSFLSSYLSNQIPIKTIFSPIFSILPKIHPTKWTLKKSLNNMLAKPLKLQKLAPFQLNTNPSCASIHDFNLTLVKHGSNDVNLQIKHYWKLH